MPLSLDDRLAILALMVRYNHAVDSGDGAAFAECWTDDGRFQGSTARAEGREELLALPPMLRARTPLTRHWNSNVVIEGDGDEARTSVYVLVVDVGEPGPTLRSSGIYSDTLRRVDGEWRFVTRTVTPDVPPKG
jgi:hypothetical protein